MAVGSDAVGGRPLCTASNAVARAADRCIQKALARVELLLPCGPDEFLATVLADQLLILKVHEATLRRGSRFDSARLAASRGTLVSVATQQSGTGPVASQQ